MLVLVTGAKGMLGSAIMEYSKILVGYNFVGIDKDTFDICDITSLSDFINTLMPDVIIHCAAYTQVDKAEHEEEKVFRINSMVVQNLAAICFTKKIKLVLISTDYVFDGTKEEPYNEYDTPNPINVYGSSKYYAERYLLQICPKSYIVRTSWLFGKNGNNFVSTIIDKAKTSKQLNVVFDQIGSPTYVNDLAKFLVELINTDKYGIYHATNSNYCSWFEFAKEICRLLNININVFPVSSAQYITNAKRPKNSRLGNYALKYGWFTPFRSWQEALKCFLFSKEVI